MPQVGRTTLAALLVLLSFGCQRRATLASVPPRDAALQEDHCWWAVVRSPLSPDSLAERFAAAFTDVGFSSIRQVRVGDTTVVQAGPSSLPSGESDLVASRVVAYSRGDSTHFRHYLAFGGEVSGQRLGLCRDIARTAAVRASAPREPTGEESLPVWTRRLPPGTPNP